MRVLTYSPAPNSTEIVNFYWACVIVSVTVFIPRGVKLDNRGKLDPGIY